MSTIVVKRPGRADEVVLLPDAETVVGRSADAGLVVDERAVSRRHALLVGSAEPGTHSIRDLDSVNGTWVNGKRIGTSDVPLASGDRITLGRGRVVLQYFADDATMTQEEPTLGGGLFGPWDAPWVAGRWRRVTKWAPWIRLAGAVLTSIGAVLGILYWISRLLAD